MKKHGALVAGGGGVAMRPEGNGEAEPFAKSASGSSLRRRRGPGPPAMASLSPFSSSHWYRWL